MTDPSPADTLAMQRLLDNHDINVLLYNVQTVTPVTTQIRALARQHGIPIVGVSETMPDGAATYQKWQQSLGYSGKDADGIPGEVSLSRLGARFGFKVTA